MEHPTVEPTTDTVSTDPNAATNTGKEVAVRAKAMPIAQESGVQAIIPRNIPEATVYANGLVAADIVPDAFRYKDGPDKGKPDVALLIMGILTVMELGVGPQTGLKWLLPLRGRFTIWGDLAIALAQRKGLVKDHQVNWIGPAFDENAPLGEWPDLFGCEYRIWRVGQEKPYIGIFTVLDAKRPNPRLWMNASKKPWVEFPKRMLFNRARAFALRDGFADALNGLDLAEEVIDHMPIEEKPAAIGADISALREDETTTNGAENGE